MSLTVVLVPGAWHGAWCFDRVIPLVEASGISCIALDPPGHGASDQPFTDLYGDADFVRSVLDSVVGDVVLLGHSYGGAVVTQAGSHPSVRHIVYLAAFALDGGETCTSVQAALHRSLPDDPRPNLASGIVVDPLGRLGVTPETVRDCMYNDCDPETVAWAVGHVGVQPALNLDQGPTDVAWRKHPSTYVVCTQDLAIYPELQKMFASRCTNIKVLDASHSPFASMPDQVSAILVDLATL